MACNPLPTEQQKWKKKAEIELDWSHEKPGKKVSTAF
jgi:hypothetical protein